MILAGCVAIHSPVPVNRLDDETESGRDIIDVFIHHALDYGRFPSIVQASLHHQLGRTVLASGLHVTTYSSNIRISLSFNRALRSIESILPVLRSVHNRPTSYSSCDTRATGR